jgi:hypothetical protein
MHSLIFVHYTIVSGKRENIWVKFRAEEVDWGALGAVIAAGGGAGARGWRGIKPGGGRGLTPDGAKAAKTRLRPKNLRRATTKTG